MKTRLSLATAFVVLVAAASWHTLVGAQEPPAPVEQAPTLVEGSVLEDGGPTIVVEPPVEILPPIEAAPCLPIHVVRESASLSAKRTYRCYGAPVHQVLCVDNPADCTECLYAVNVCVPACCVGEPICCDQRVGLLGRGYVVYRWPCGFEVEIAFRVHGGVILRYR